MRTPESKSSFGNGSSVAVDAKEEEITLLRTFGADAATDVVCCKCQSVSICKVVRKLGFNVGCVERNQTRKQRIPN